jgi:hypothetical protein
VDTYRSAWTVEPVATAWTGAWFQRGRGWIQIDQRGNSFYCAVAGSYFMVLWSCGDRMRMATLFGNECGLVCRGFMLSSVTKYMHRHRHYITLLYLFTMLAILVHLFCLVQ